MRNALLTIGLLVVAMLVAPPGCDGGRSAPAPPTTASAGNLVLRDAAKAVVATADLQLPATLPAAGQTFQGTWRLVSARADYPTDATQRGTYEATVGAGELFIDLNPGVADNNLVLRGPTGTDPITGTWSHATFAGPKPMGTFALSGGGVGWPPFGP